MERLISSDSHVNLQHDTVKRNLASKYHESYDAAVAEFQSRVFGGNAGKELELAKPLTTLGKPGVQVAVLTRRPQGYFLTHVEGTKQPTVNGQSIGAAPHMLKDHDVIEIAGVKMEYFVKS